MIRMEPIRFYVVAVVSNDPNCCQKLRIREKNETEGLAGQPPRMTITVIIRVSNPTASDSGQCELASSKQQLCNPTVSDSGHCSKLLPKSDIT